MELKHTEAKFRTKSGESKSNDAAYLKDQRMLQHSETEIGKLKDNLGRIAYVEGTLERLEERKVELQEQRRDLRTKIDRAGGHRYELKYRDPEPNFDRNRVFGMLCMLFDVRDAQRNAMALGVCAGGAVNSYISVFSKHFKIIVHRRSFIMSSPIRTQRRN